jgi:serine/threonine protein phosphatase PrpC
MRIGSAGNTDTGRVRMNNEDTFLVDDALGLYAVADGMGGHAGGETASSMAVAYLQKTVQALINRTAGTDASSPENTAIQVLENGFIAANRAVFEAGSRDPALRGMGTTLTALLREGGLMHIAHIGDSRAYLFRSSVLEQLTRDHSLVGEQVRAGLLTPEAARSNPYRHVITRVVGVDPAERPDLKTVVIRSGDVFLLVSDGLTEMVTDEDIRRILADTTVALIANRLIERANELGGIDNITVVAVSALET